MNYVNPKIFIVEDDIFYAEVLSQYLTQNGFENHQVFCDGEALEKHLHQMPDIVLLDYNLGNTNGVDLLKKVKAFNSNIQVVLLSAQEEMEVAINSLKYGAFDYLEKNDHAFTKLRNIIGRICHFNEEIFKSKRRFDIFHKMKRLALAITLSSLLAAILFA